MTRKIEHHALASLQPDPRNPKAHHLETIDASINRFGYVEPVVLDGRTGFIVSGHGRTKTLQAMEARGDGAPEGVHVSEDGRWYIPVVTGWSSRTDAEAAAALIALNRTTELGGWVDDALLDMLQELSEMEDGLAGVGFSDADREALEALTNRVHEDDTDRDLDALADEFGDPTDDDALVRVVLKVPADLAKELNAHIDSFESHEVLGRALLDLAP